MPLQDSDLTERVRQALRASGAARSVELQQTCSASQASISRALAPLLSSGEVLKVGRSRAQGYVMPRTVDAAGASQEIPLTKVDADGDVTPFGALIPVVGSRYWVEEEDGPSALHAGLPWFIADMRPTGFLGRAFAHAHPELRLAANPDQWSDDDVLKALCLAGEDLPGNLLVGASSFDRYLQLAPAPPSPDGAYPALAEAAMHGALPGSSAGGEQPKFCTVRADGRHVIVKFSPAGDGAAPQRWRDLLRCEHHALRTLDGGGIPAARTRVLEAGGRVFLEVERFDRTHAGRIGMVSLLAYDAEYVGQMDNWAATATRMAARNLMTEADAQLLRVLEAFGRLIGNTDRHYGNISLLIDGGVWRLAPAYDQLPMLYAPVGGELVERDFDPAAVAPTADTLREWKAARALARDFWRSVAADRAISKEFRSLAQRHAAGLAGAGKVSRPAQAESTFQRERPS